MQEKGTLNYYKEYVVLDPGGAKKATFPELRKLCDDPELYAALLKEDGEDHGYWAVIDAHGDYVTPAKYSYIDSKVTQAGERRIILVRYEDRRENFITLDGHEIFTENQRGFLLPFYNTGQEICVLCGDDYRYGLCNLATGKIILEPRYSGISEIENAEIFRFYDEPDYDISTWGLLGADGEVLFEPQFTSVTYDLYWRGCNVLSTGADPSMGGKYRFVILDYDGNQFYVTWSVRSQYRSLDVWDQGVWFDTKNAFIFFEDRGSWLKRGVAKLVICEYDDEHEGHVAYDCTFRYSEEWHDFNDICRLAYRAAKKHNLQDKILYRSY